MIRTTYLLTSLTAAALRLTSNTQKPPKMMKKHFLLSPNEISDPNQNPFKSKLINWIMGGVIDWLDSNAHTHGRLSSSQQMDQFAEMNYFSSSFIVIESIKNIFGCLLLLSFVLHRQLSLMCYEVKFKLS